jgi:hypothetical protein
MWPWWHQQLEGFMQELLAVPRPQFPRFVRSSTASRGLEACYLPQCGEEVTEEVNHG